MTKINFEGYPNGTTKLIIHELQKAVQDKTNALTESIDDAIDAVNDSSSSVVNVIYDKELHVLKVSDIGFGIGMSKTVCEQITSGFFSHNFTTVGISKFGLGRFYPFAIMGDYPNMRFRTSTGDGVMREVLCSIPNIENEIWVRSVDEYPCEKGIHGIEVIFEKVNLSDEEWKEMQNFYSIHYSLTNCTIKFNGNPIKKFNPCYIEKLPDGINTPDGIYATDDGFVFKVDTHFFTSEKKIVRFKTVAVSITQKAFDNRDEKNGVGANIKDSTSASMGGFYGCIGSNILNKGNNALPFFNLTFTRGGSGITRLFMKVIQDDDNVFGLNDVKACGYAPFSPRRFELNKFKNNEGKNLYNTIYEIVQNCRKLYDRIGQKKHSTYTKDEIYKIAQETYNLNNKKAKNSKTCAAVKKASKDIHMKYIEEMYDYVTPTSNTQVNCDEKMNSRFNGIYNVSIPKNKEKELHIEVNAKSLPSDWASLTKEDILIGVGRYFIEELGNSTLFNKFNNNFISHIKHYDK